MDTSSTMKVLDLYAGMPTFRITRICVYGYDYHLPEDDIKKELIKVFSSCGEILQYYNAPRYSKSIMMMIRGGVKDKALQLSGTQSNIGTLNVFDVSEEDIGTDFFARRDQEIMLCSSAHVCVSGYDSKLPVDYIKNQLVELFSSCGEIAEVSVDDILAVLYIIGEGAKEKALKFNGVDMGGQTLSVVVPVSPNKEDPKEKLKPYSTRIAVSGYDNSLSDDDIRRALYDHFDSYGYPHVHLLDITTTRDHATGSCEAHVFLMGHREEYIAMQLDGSYMGDCLLKVSVEALQRPREPEIEKETGRRFRYGDGIGFPGTHGLFPGTYPGFGFPGTHPTGLFHGTHPFRYGFPSTGPTGYGFPNTGPTGYGFPGTAPTGYPFPGTGPIRYGFPGGYGFPGPYPQ